MIGFDREAGDEEEGGETGSKILTKVLFMSSAKEDERSARVDANRARRRLTEQERRTYSRRRELGTHSQEMDLGAS